MVFGLIKELRIKQLARKFKPKNFLNISVLGAAGGIGQPLSLLIRESPYCNELRLYDINRVEGIATDLSHCNVEGEVYAFNSANLVPCLKGADIVVISAGKPRSPGMTRDQLFETNAKIIADLVSTSGQVCPKAKILIITNPINSVVPLAAEVLKKIGVYDPKRLMGITKLDGIRSITFLSELINKPPKSMIVPVIGGHAGETIVPLWSKTHRPLQYGVKPPGFKYKSFTKEQLDELTHDVQYGGDAVVQAKHGSGSATLAMAYSGGMFVEKLAKAMNGEPNIYDYAFVDTTKEATPFFSTRCRLSQDGIEEAYHIEDLAPREAEMVQKMLPTLRKQIDKGVEYGRKYEIKPVKK